MKVSNVDPLSPLFGRIRPGYQLLSINGVKVLDSIDFRFRTAFERFHISFADTAGTEIAFQFDHSDGDDLGLTFDDRKVLTCKNDCIFCFVSQQPQGMRRVLYIKDEDFRLSFTHGNFVTLSNASDDDIKRIIDQRLSPIYVSVHATDDKLRRCMLRNEKLAPIVPRLKELTRGGIKVHTQVVLCPEINDGQALATTITQLSDLYPGVETLAVVPVGLTRYRSKLPGLRKYTAREASKIIDFIESTQKSLLSSIGSRFVWPADEFYVAAERPFPRHREYEDMAQFENGIGMVREFITVFNRRRARLKSLRSERRALILTGHSAHPFLSKEVLPYIRSELKLDVELQAVSNRFWGDSVTVSGLLTGQDLLRAARSRKELFDVCILPPNCLNDDSLFLDNLSLAQFESVLDRPVVVGQYNLAATLSDVFS
ncbi:MAG: DUF512 domain-containing protein [Candidatus Zixiibacteriota bacterium]